MNESQERNDEAGFPVPLTPVERAQAMTALGILLACSNRPSTSPINRAAVKVAEATVYNGLGCGMNSTLQVTKDGYPPKVETARVSCWLCDGTGTWITCDVPCRDCNGLGYVLVEA